MHKIFLATCLAALLPAAAVDAQDAQATPSQEATLNVEVKHARVRFVSYKESYDMARKVQEATAGRVAVGLILTPAKPGVRIDDIQLWLESEHSSTELKVVDGLFVVPVNAQVAAQNGSYTINKQKGDLTARIAVLPAIARDAWTVGKVRQVIGDARNAINKFTPWYQKPFAMKIHSVSVCSAEAGAEIKLMQGDTVLETLTTSEKNTDDTGHPVYCKAFTEDARYDDQWRIAVPEQAQVLFL